MTKFVVLQPIKRKTAEEVVNPLFDIFCLLGPLTFYKATTVGDSMMLIWLRW